MSAAAKRFFQEAEQIENIIAQCKKTGGKFADQTFYQTLEGQIKCEKIKRIDQSWPSMDFTLFVGTFLLFAVVSAVLFLFHAQINFLRQFFF